MPFFKNLDRIYNKMGRVGLLGQSLGAQLENRRPPYRNPCRRRQMTQNTLAPVAVWGASEDALSSKVQDDDIAPMSRCRT
jgi:hypothetical protein